MSHTFKGPRGSPCVSKLVELSSAREYDDSNLCITQNRQLFGFLKQPITPLGERNQPAIQILNLLDLNLSYPHGSLLPSCFYLLKVPSLYLPNTGPTNI